MYRVSCRLFVRDLFLVDGFLSASRISPLVDDDASLVLARRSHFH